MTAGIEFIRDEMDWDKHDPWASVMSALFDLAEAWYESQGERVNGYKPSEVDTGEFESERAARLSGAMDDGIIDNDDLWYWLTVLNRVRYLVIQARKDY